MIVKKSLDDIILRGDNLGGGIDKTSNFPKVLSRMKQFSITDSCSIFLDVSRKAKILDDEARSFSKTARHLNWKIMVQKYGTFGAFAVFIFLVIFFKLRGC
jgi:hypothetical protein